MSTIQQDHATYAKNGEFDVYVKLAYNCTYRRSGIVSSQVLVVSDAAKNYGKYSNSDLDDIVAKLHETFDTDERGKLAVEAQQTILDDDAYFLFSFEYGTCVKVKCIRADCSPM